MFKVAQVPGKGKGLLADVDIPEGTYLGVYPGGEDCFCYLVGDFRFANHSVEPNCEWVYDGDTITFWATQEIKAGDEISYDYDCRLWFVPEE